MLIDYNYDLFLEFYNIKPILIGTGLTIYCQHIGDDLLFLTNYMNSKGSLEYIGKSFILRYSNSIKLLNKYNIRAGDRLIYNPNTILKELRVRKIQEINK